MKNFYSLIAFLIVFIFLGCDEIPPEIPPFQKPDSDRVLILEELTGVRCPNCPGGAEILKELSSKYDGNIILVAIHTPFLGNPWPSSKYNFITEGGNAIEGMFGPYLGKPALGISRKHFEGEQFTLMDIKRPWESYIQQELETFADFYIDIDNSFDKDNRNLEIEIDLEAQLSLDGNYFMNVMLLESGIVDAQEDLEGVKDDYEHNHVFRKLITPLDGDGFRGSYETLETTTLSYDFTLPEEDGTWIAENMEVVVFITELDEDCNCKTIVQAGHQDLID